MARKKSRRKAKAKVPFYVGPIAGAFIGSLTRPYGRKNWLTYALEGDMKAAINVGQEAFSGYHVAGSKWEFGNMRAVHGGAIGLVASKAASLAGVNSRIPNIGKYSIRV